MNSELASRIWQQYREATIRFEQASSAVLRHDRYRSVPTADELQSERDAWIALEAARRAIADSLAQRKGPARLGAPDAFPNVIGE